VSVLGWAATDHERLRPPRALACSARMAPTLAQIRDALATLENIELHAPPTEAQVAAFEARVGITLPGEFRAFVLQVCDGIGLDGDPWLYSLDDMLVDLAPPPRRPGPSRDPSRPFLYGDGEARALRAAMTSAEGSLMGDRSFMSLQRRMPYEGCLTVGYNGGNDFHALVVTGDQRGAIWRTGEIDYPEPPEGAGDPDASVGFVDWFLRWVPDKLGATWPWAAPPSR
jgi:hypothetical protein